MLIKFKVCLRKNNNIFIFAKPYSSRSRQWSIKYLCFCRFCFALNDVLLNIYFWFFFSLSFLNRSRSWNKFLTIEYLINIAYPFYKKVYRVEKSSAHSHRTTYVHQAFFLRDTEHKFLTNISIQQLFYQIN